MRVSCWIRGKITSHAEPRLASRNDWQARQSPECSSTVNDSPGMMSSKAWKRASACVLNFCQSGASFVDQWMWKWGELEPEGMDVDNLRDTLRQVQST